MWNKAQNENKNAASEILQGRQSVVGSNCCPVHDLTPAQNEDYITYCRLKVDV